METLVRWSVPVSPWFPSGMFPVVGEEWRTWQELLSQLPLSTGLRWSERVGTQQTKDVAETGLEDQCPVSEGCWLV